RIFEDAQKAANGEETEEKKETRKKKSTKKAEPLIAVEKATLGDIEELAALKNQLDADEKK
ncbi:MAG: hypothetical protein J6T83_00710, partial [Paludibacteraceae bacterium]|nr:hypothetical protein [Paludibacteraceae bacterium]